KGELSFSDSIRTFGYELRSSDVAWWLDRVHPDDRSRVETSYHAAIDSAELTYTAEYRFRRADGTFADVLDRAGIIRDTTARATRDRSGLPEPHRKRDQVLQQREEQDRRSLREACDGLPLRGCGQWPGHRKPALRAHLPALPDARSEGQEQHRHRPRDREEDR